MSATVIPTNELDIILAIELPFWIPIKTGNYILRNAKSIWVRNDLWIVSGGNIADDADPPPDIIVNEDQVTDEEILERRTRGNASYFHKRKMKTTFTRTISDDSIGGIAIPSKPTDELYQELDKTVFESLQKKGKLDDFLHDANLFIEHYSTLINPQNASREVRPVSFYETMIHLRVNFLTEHFRIDYITRITPDWIMVDQPHPLSRVKDHGILEEFKEATKKSPPVAFHQLEWIKTLNCRREKRYQDALLHATITLEALAHIYLTAEGI